MVLSLMSTCSHFGPKARVQLNLERLAMPNPSQLPLVSPFFLTSILIPNDHQALGVLDPPRRLLVCSVWSTLAELHLLDSRISAAMPSEPEPLFQQVSRAALKKAAERRTEQSDANTKRTPKQGFPASGRSWLLGRKVLPQTRFTHRNSEAFGSYAATLNPAQGWTRPCCPTCSRTPALLWGSDAGGGS